MTQKLICDIDICQKSLGTLQEILDAVGAYVFTKDSEGRYTFVNRLVQQLFNASPEEIIGRTDADFFDLDRSGHLYENDRKVIAQGITIENEETNFIKATGEKRVYLSIKKPLHDDSGKVIGLCGISTDITERKALEDQAVRQQQLLETIMDNVDAYIYMKDDNHRFHYANYRVAELFGLPAEEIVGKLDTELMSTEYAEKVSKLDDLVFRSGKPHAGEETFSDEHGVVRHYWTVKMPLNHQNDTRMLIGFSTDITELHQLKEQLRIQSITDDLTGLRNRRFFFGALEKELARARRQDLPSALISLDVDFFKNINDSYGHPVGDKVLVHISTIICDNIRAEDTAARVGGEEFTVLLPNSDFEEALTLAERIRKKICETPIPYGEGQTLDCTVSIGLACASNGGLSADALYSAADKMLYQAKQSGRNCVCG